MGRGTHVFREAILQSREEILERQLMERETIRKVRDAVRSRRLKNRFTPSDVNRVLGIHWAGTFLPKHRVGNPGGFSELFVRVSRGLYELT